MKRFILHEAFNMYHFTADTWEHPVHKHTYYEMIFVLKGKGRHELNDKSIPYAKGDFFFLGPEDYHAFNIVRETEFCYIRFTPSFFNKEFEGGRIWDEALRLLFDSSRDERNELRIEDKEREKLFSLMLILKTEYENRYETHFELIRDSVMASMLCILARNIKRQAFPTLRSRSSVIDHLLLYIREHILDPEKLTMEHLAEKFNYAPTYLSIFFKQSTGEPLKSFIVKYKLKLVEARLLYTQNTLGEIAYEFGYADESHLCKQFRKYNGVTPAQFRKKI